MLIAPVRDLASALLRACYQALRNDLATSQDQIQQWFTQQVHMIVTWYSENESNRSLRTRVLEVLNENSNFRAKVETIKKVAETVLDSILQITDGIFQSPPAGRSRSIEEPEQIQEEEEESGLVGVSSSQRLGVTSLGSESDSDEVSRRNSSSSFPRSNRDREINGESDLSISRRASI